MCRLLAVSCPRPFPTRAFLEPFAELCRRSPVYQGHGWGLALRAPGRRLAIHRDLRPVWEDDVSRFGTTTLLLAHARSAFRDEGIAIENNMPFFDGRYVFLFNGELQGVRLRESGRIGAEKVFNFIKRFGGGEGGAEAALRRATAILEKRCRYLRALNVIMSDGRAIHVGCRFNEDPDYFMMRYRPPAGSGGELVVCSEVFGDPAAWRPVGDGEVLTFPCS